MGECVGAGLELGQSDFMPGRDTAVNFTGNDAMKITLPTTWLLTQPDWFSSDSVAHFAHALHLAVNDRFDLISHCAGRQLVRHS